MPPSVVARRASESVVVAIIFYGSAGRGSTAGGPAARRMYARRCGCEELKTWWVLEHSPERGRTALRETLHGPIQVNWFPETDTRSFYGIATFGGCCIGSTAWR